MCPTHPHSGQGGGAQGRPPEDLTLNSGLKGKHYRQDKKGNPETSG